MPSRTMIVLPTYNEMENLSLMVQAIFALGLPGLEILVVDDNSPDGTGRLADEIALADPERVRVLHRAGKQGLGRAYVAGFKRALELGADYIIEMDADFSHSPSYLPKMIEKMAEYDVVVGSRYVPGGSVDKNWSLSRKLLSWWGSRVYAPLILGLPVHDATGGFKCFRRQALNAIDLDQVRSNGYAFQVEMNYICARKGFRIYELPIHFADRKQGTSKMDWRISAEAMWRVWQIKFRH
jgi:dolichol-phosphate mannosyltransferase